jgi:hypothetical protein
MLEFWLAETRDIIATGIDIRIAYRVTWEDASRHVNLDGRFDKDV